jgi:hypothetical protein
VKVRRYSELRRLDTFEDRFDYLKLPGSVGVDTLGFDRYLGQGFYKSAEWKAARSFVIARDNGCDLGVPGYEIHDSILVHHLNPIAIKDLTHGDDWIINPDFLITTTQRTHNAIHYGNRESLYRPHVERAAGDTKLW